MRVFGVSISYYPIWNRGIQMSVFHWLGYHSSVNSNHHSNIIYYVDGVNLSFLQSPLPWLCNLCGKSKNFCTESGGYSEMQSPKMFLIRESFIGLVNYYGKFIPKMAEVAYSLNHVASSGKCELELEGGRGEKACKIVIDWLTLIEYWRKGLVYSFTPLPRTRWKCAVEKTQQPDDVVCYADTTRKGQDFGREQPGGAGGVFDPSPVIDKEPKGPNTTCAVEQQRVCTARQRSIGTGSASVWTLSLHPVTPVQWK